MSTQLYPTGSGGIKSKYNAAGALVFYHPTTGAELYRFDPAVTGGMIVPGALRSLRTRFTIAQINAGASFLPAITGFKYRMIGAIAIAFGGAVGATTTVDILATQGAASVKLVAYAQASLTQSAVLTSGIAGAAVLADGASYVACDAATAITVSKTGASLTVATGVDLIFQYVLEP